MTLVRFESPEAMEHLSDQALRVHAVRAASTHDTDGLALLLQTYLRSGSRQGARTSGRTVEAYTLGVQTFVPWARENGVQLLRPGRRDAGRYVAHLQTRPNRGRGRAPYLSAATVAQYVAGVRALYRALEWAGATDLQPFSRVSIRPDPTASIVKNPPYQDELEDVLRMCDDRLGALLLLCAHSGLRIGEALAVRRSDVRGQHLTVYGKGGKRRMVPLGRRVRAALAGLSPVRPPDGYFDWTYSQVSHLMKSTFAAAGHAGTWRGFHAARKASGTRLYRATRDFTRVSLFLGHASVDTTRRYVAVQQDDVSTEVEDF